MASEARTLVEGYPASIPCTLHNESQVNWTWTDGIVTRHIDTTSTSSAKTRFSASATTADRQGALLLQPVLKEDRGCFTCQATNGDPRTYTTCIAVLPHDSAQIVFSMRRDATLLTCRAQGRPRPHVEWTNGFNSLAPNYCNEEDHTGMWTSATIIPLSKPEQAVGLTAVCVITLQGQRITLSREIVGVSEFVRPIVLGAIGLGVELMLAILAFARRMLQRRRRAAHINMLQV